MPQNPLLHEFMAYVHDTEVLQRGGYDGGAEVGFLGKWYEIRFQELNALLETKTNEAKENSCGTAEIEVAGVPFRIRAFGANGGVYYAYVLEGYGLKIMIHNKPAKNIQPIRVRYGAESLIGRNLFEVHVAVLSFLESLGFQIEKETLSRVDLQVIVEHSMQEFAKLLLPDMLIKRARHFNIHGNGNLFETQTFGTKNSIELCFYDKRAETKKMGRSDSIKYDLTVEHCLGREPWLDGVDFTRIEFRLSRSALKNLEINTLEDLKMKEAGIVDWLTKDWFRILETKKIRGHENTQPMNPIWNEVRAMFAKYFPGPDGEKPPVKWKKRSRISCDVTHLIKQAVGCFSSAVGLSGGAFENCEDALSLAVQGLWDHRDRLFERSKEIAKEMQVIKGVSLGDPRDAMANDPDSMMENYFQTIEKNTVA